MKGKASMVTLKQSGKFPSNQMDWGDWRWFATKNGIGAFEAVAINEDAPSTIRGREAFAGATLIR
jgi:hypothetical protein